MCIRDRYEIGDRVELLISRDGRLFSETVDLERRTTEDWSIGWLSDLSDEQQERINTWLEIEPPVSDKAEEEGDAKTSDEKPPKKKKRRGKKPRKS